MQKVKLRLHYKYCMPAWIFFISDWPNMSQLLSRKRRGQKKKKKKKSTLLNWCTTHVSASWLEREIRGMCRKTGFLQQCSHFPFHSGYSGLWPDSSEGIVLTGNLPRISKQQTWDDTVELMNAIKFSTLSVAFLKKKKKLLLKPYTITAFFFVHLFKMFCFQLFYQIIGSSAKLVPVFV